MSRAPIGKHGRDHRPAGTLGPDDPGGHDPIPLNLGIGLIGGTASVDLAVRQPGSLLVRYMMGEPSGSLADTSGYDANAVDLGYANNQASIPSPGNPHGETALVDLSYDVAHPEFGDGDDGQIGFNYNQQYVDLNPGSASSYYPGAWFVAGPSGKRVQFRPPSELTYPDAMRAFSVFFKPTAGGHLSQAFICGVYENTSFGEVGWRLYYDYTTNLLHFDSLDSGGAGPSLVTPGALTPGVEYQAGVDWDGATWRLILDGVPVATEASSSGGTGVGSPSATQLTIGNRRWVAGFAGSSSTTDHFFYGAVDEFDSWGVPLTDSEWAAVANAKGAGTTTSYETVTIGAGSSTDPFAIRSGDATDAVLVSDNEGGSEWTKVGTAMIFDGAVTNAKLEDQGPGATGPVGDSTTVPVITIDAKGRVTALTSAAITGGGGGGGTYVGASVTMSADYSLANNAVTVLPWTAEQWDTNVFHDNVTNNSRITIPTGEAGKYLVTVEVGNFYRAGVSTGRRFITLRKNGSSVQRVEVACPSTGECWINLSIQLDLAVGDYLEVDAYQTSGGAVTLSVTPASSAGQSIFQVAKVG